MNIFNKMPKALAIGVTFLFILPHLISASVYAADIILSYPVDQTTDSNISSYPQIKEETPKSNITTQSTINEQILSYPVQPISYPVITPTSYTISGKKFNDVNANGNLDNNEAGLVGWKITAVKEVDNFLVNGKDINGTNSKVLEAGNYLIKAEGTWYGGDDISKDNFDAEFDSEDNWATYSDGPLLYGKDQGDLLINNSTLDWGSYTSNHTYFHYYTLGQSSSLNLSVLDGAISSTTKIPAWYNDNSGALTIHIYKIVDESVTDSNGNYTLTVPNTIGNVNVYEVQQNGWRLTTPDHYGYIEVSSTSSNLNFGNIKINNLATISVSNKLLDMGGKELHSSQIFKVYLDNKKDSTQDINSSLVNPMVASFSVEPGVYEINETVVTGYVNLGCRLENSSNNMVLVKLGDKVSIVCTNQKVNLIPSVVITPTPSAVVTEPSTILLEAVVTGGDGTIKYTWNCTTGELSNAPTIALSTIGSHQCTVIVMDIDGDTASASGTFIIAAKPVIVPTTNSNNGNSSNNNSSNSSNNPSGSTGEGITTTIPGTPTEVLGTKAQVCDSKSTVSGYVFIDKNSNNSKDSEEEGVSNVDITIFGYDFDKDSKKTEVEVRTLKTNTLGRWETALCPADYKIQINTKDLSSDFKLGGDDNFTFTVTKSVDKDNVNFAVYPQAQNNTNTNWWIFLIPIVLLVLAAGGYAIYSTNQRRNL